MRHQICPRQGGFGLLGTLLHGPIGDNVDMSSSKTETGIAQPFLLELVQLPSRFDANNHAESVIETPSALFPLVFSNCSVAKDGSVAILVKVEEIDHSLIFSCHALDR